MANITSAAVIGAGVIGGGWAARLALNGVAVKVYDPTPDAERKLTNVIDNATRALAKLSPALAPIREAITFCGSIEEAVTDVPFIQESVPERLDIKQSLHSEIGKFAPVTALVGSSTSGLLPTDIQASMDYPRRMFVAHPYSPVYLLPLVELVAGQRTEPETLERARQLFHSLGMKPVIIRKEIDAFVGDRLLEALWREALWLLHDDVATVAEIDDIISHSFGLRWAQMGLFMTYRLGGGEAGMEHFLRQFAPSLKWPWTHLMDVPELDGALMEKIVRQSDAQAGDHPIQALERIRDDNLVAIIRALRDSGATGWGAGAVLAEHEQRVTQTIPNDSARRLFETPIKPAWLDDQGFLATTGYTDILAQNMLALSTQLGMDTTRFGYRLDHLKLNRILESKNPAGIYSTVRPVAWDDTKLDTFHLLYRQTDNQLLASAEVSSSHVALDNRRQCSMDANLLKRLSGLSAVPTESSSRAPASCQSARPSPTSMHAVSPY